MKIHIFSYPEFILEIPHSSLPDVLEVDPCTAAAPPPPPPPPPPPSSSSSFSSCHVTVEHWPALATCTPLKKSVLLAIQNELFSVLSSDLRYKLHYTYLPLPLPPLKEEEEVEPTALQQKEEQSEDQSSSAAATTAAGAEGVSATTRDGKEMEQQKKIRKDGEGGGGGSRCQQEGSTKPTTSTSTRIPLYVSLAADPWTLLQRIQQIRQCPKGLTDASTIHPPLSASSANSSPFLWGVGHTNPLWWSPSLSFFSPSSSSSWGTKTTSSTLASNSSRGGRGRSGAASPTTGAMMPPPPPAGIIFVSEVKQLPVLLAHSTTKQFSSSIGLKTKGKQHKTIMRQEGGGKFVEEEEEEGEVPPDLHSSASVPPLCASSSPSLRNVGASPPPPILSFFSLWKRACRRREKRKRREAEEEEGVLQREEGEEPSRPSCSDMLMKEAGGEVEGTAAFGRTGKEVGVRIPCNAELSYVGHQWWTRYRRTGSISSSSAAAAAASTSSSPSGIKKEEEEEETGKGLKNSSNNNNNNSGSSLFFSSQDQTLAESQYFGRHHYRTLYITDSRVAAELFLLCLRSGFISLPFHAKLYALYRPPAKRMRTADYGKFIHPHTVAPDQLRKKLESLQHRANLDEDLWSALTEGLKSITSSSCTAPLSSGGGESQRHHSSNTNKNTNNPWLQVQAVYERIKQEQEEHVTQGITRDGRLGESHPQRAIGGRAGSGGSTSSLFLSLSSPTALHERHLACALRFSEEHISYAAVLNEEEEASPFLVGMGLFFPQALTWVPSSFSGSTALVSTAPSRGGGGSGGVAASLPFPGLADAPLTLEDLLVCFISHPHRHTLVQALGLYVARYAIPPEELPLFFFQAFSESGVLAVEGGGTSRSRCSSSSSSHHGNIIPLKELAVMLLEQDEVHEAWLPRIDALWKDKLLHPAIIFFQDFWEAKRKIWMREMMQFSSSTMDEDEDEEKKWKEEEKGEEEKKKKTEELRSFSSSSSLSDSSLGLLSMVIAELRFANAQLAPRQEGSGFSSEQHHQQGKDGGRSSSNAVNGRGNGVGGFGFRSIRELVRHALEKEEQAFTASKAKRITTLLSSRWMCEDASDEMTEKNKKQTSPNLQHNLHTKKGLAFRGEGKSVGERNRGGNRRGQEEEEDGNEKGEDSSCDDSEEEQGAEGETVGGSGSRPSFSSSPFVFRVPHLKRTRDGITVVRGGKEGKTTGNRASLEDGGRWTDNNHNHNGADDGYVDHEDDEDDFLLRVQVGSSEEVEAGGGGGGGFTSSTSHGVAHMFEMSGGPLIKGNSSSTPHPHSSSFSSSEKVKKAQTPGRRDHPSQQDPLSSSSIPNGKTIAGLHRDVQLHGYGVLMSLLGRSKPFDDKSEHYIEF